MKKERKIKETILSDLLAACDKLRANGMHYAASEKQRNDFIRDLLKMAKYDVKDQTRRELSSVGRCYDRTGYCIKH